jgi:hypothetical protein
MCLKETECLMHKTANSIILIQEKQQFDQLNTRKTEFDQLNSRKTAIQSTNSLKTAIQSI